MYVSYASLFALFYMIWSFKFLKILLYVVVRRLFPLTVSTHDGLVHNMKKEIFLFFYPYEGSSKTDALICATNFRFLRDSVSKGSSVTWSATFTTIFLLHCFANRSIAWPIYNALYDVGDGFDSQLPILLCKSAPIAALSLKLL